MKNGALYQKEDLIDLTLNTALMNCFAEGFAKTLREHKHAPTSETLLDYLKTAKKDAILKTAKVQIDRCVATLKKKGIHLDKAAIAFDWHDQPYYGSHQTEGVVGTKPKDGTAYAYCYLTVSVITPKKRLVLAVLPLKTREGLTQIVLSLLNLMMQYVKNLAYAAFDSGFQDSELLQAFSDRNVPFVIPLHYTVKLRRRWRWKPTTCGKIEAFHHAYEVESHLFKEHWSFIRYYNYTRPHESLNYLTPAEIYLKDKV